MNDSTFSLWLSMLFLMLFFLAMIAVLMWWMNKQEEANRRYLRTVTETADQSLKEMRKVTETISRSSLGQLEILNKAMTLLSVKDPLTYQAIVGMEVQNVTSSDDEYYPQDDVSEALRREELANKGDNDSSNEWTDPHRAVNYDPISGSYGDGT